MDEISLTCWNCEGTYPINDSSPSKCPQCGAEMVLGTPETAIVSVCSGLMCGGVAGTLYWLVGMISEWWTVDFLEAMITVGLGTALPIGVVCLIAILFTNRQTMNNPELREKGAEIRRAREPQVIPVKSSPPAPPPTIMEPPVKAWLYRTEYDITSTYADLQRILTVGRPAIFRFKCTAYWPVIRELSEFMTSAFGKDSPEQQAAILSPVICPKCTTLFPDTWALRLQGDGSPLPKMWQ